LDDYLERDKGGFLDFIDYQRLHADVSAEEAYVIEGVCLLHAVQRAKLAIDTLVYVKRRHLGLWADERELDLDEPLEDFLQNERELTAMVACAGHRSRIGRRGHPVSLHSSTARQCPHRLLSR